MTAKSFQTRTIILLDEQRRKLAINALSNAPLGIEVVMREPVKARKLNQSDLMWAGPLKDIEEQAWVEGQQFSAEVWHELMKRKYLPEDDDPDLERLTLTGYRKWDYLPDGERVMVGTTTRLSVRGMAQYLEQVYAFGSSLGVMFSAAPR